MRRAPFVVGATGVGLGLLLSFHTKPLRLSSVSTGTGESNTAPTTGRTTPANGGTSAAPTTPPTSGPSGGTTPATSPSTPPTATSPSTTTGVRSATGQDIQYRYGDIQLRVTERGSSITNIQIVQESATDPRSEEINSQAIPMLQQQALSAKSANIDGVSGATFTSVAYQDALQSALDRLK